MRTLRRTEKKTHWLSGSRHPQALDVQAASEDVPRTNAEIPGIPGMTWMRGPERSNLVQSRALALPEVQVDSAGIQGQPEQGAAGSELHGCGGEN